MRAMRAVIIREFGGPEVLEVCEVEDPRPTGREIVVGVRATACNRADLLQRRGLYPAPEGVSQETPGLEFSGIVLEAGPSASCFQVGDRVMGLLAGGGYAEQVVADERLILPVPTEWSDEEAAAFPEACFTAFDALHNHLRLTSRESVLIHAVGSSVGLACLQLAKALGCVVIGTSRTREKLDRAAHLGLDDGVGTRTGHFAERVLEQTDGRGVDAIVDFVGAPYLSQNIECLALKGRLVLVGLLGGARAEIDLGSVLRKRIELRGTVLRSRSAREKIALAAQVRKRVFPLLAEGQVRPVLDRTFPLEEVARAHAYMEKNSNFGKIVLRL